MSDLLLNFQETNPRLLLEGSGWRPGGDYFSGKVGFYASKLTTLLHTGTNET